MLILSVVKNTEKLNDRVLLIRFIDGSTVTVDKFKNSVDIINKYGMPRSWANTISKDDIKTYWDILWNMAKNN